LDFPNFWQSSASIQSNAPDHANLLGDRPSMNEIKTGAQIETSTGTAGRETVRSLMDKGVEYCMPLYVDVHGIAKTKTVPINHFDRMMRGSELFTGAALDGLGQGPQDDELAVVPDPNAVMQLPWRPNVAVIPGQLPWLEGRIRISLTSTCSGWVSA